METILAKFDSRANYDFTVQALLEAGFDPADLHPSSPAGLKAWADHPTLAVTVRDFVRRHQAWTILRRCGAVETMPLDSSRAA